MINLNDHTNQIKTEHNLNWPYIPDHPYRILIPVYEDLDLEKKKCIIKTNKQPARYW